MFRIQHWINVIFLLELQQRYDLTGCCSFIAFNRKQRNINLFTSSRPLRLKGGALDIVGYHAAPLHMCQEWLEATTFDGTEVRSAFRGAWGNPENSTLETRLWMAAEMGDGRAVQNLVAAGVDINAANLCNQTALHKAAQSGHENLWCLSVLLSLGADLFAVDSSGKMPLDYAQECAIEDGPIMPVVMLEQAMSVLRPGWNATAGAKDVPATRQLLGPSLPASLNETEHSWGDTIRSSPLPLPPAAFARLRAVPAAEPPPPTPPPAVQKKKRKRYSSAKERWRALRESRRRRKAAAEAGTDKGPATASGLDRQPARDLPADSVDGA